MVFIKWWKKNRYDRDILNQVAAIKSTINQVSLALMDDHSHHCMSRAIKQNNGEESIEELIDAVQRLIKSPFHHMNASST